MDAFPGQIVAATGAVFAALLTGAFSFFNLVSSKETKVSEFRQAWINELRSEIATYISRLHAVTNLGAYIHEKLPEAEKYSKELVRERSRLYEEAIAAYHAIHLRINREERNETAKKLNGNFLSALTAAHYSYTNGFQETLDEKLDAVSDAAGPLLKFEWLRVRNGEPSYRQARGFALFILVAAFLALSVLVFCLITYKPAAPLTKPVSVLPVHSSSPLQLQQETAATPTKETAVKSASPNKPTLEP